MPTLQLIIVIVILEITTVHYAQFDSMKVIIRSELVHPKGKDCAN